MQTNDRIHSTMATTKNIIPNDSMEQNRTIKPNKTAALVLSLAALALVALSAVDAFSFGTTNASRPNGARLTTLSTVHNTPLGPVGANLNHQTRNLVRLYETPSGSNESTNTQPAKRNNRFESLLVAAAFVTASLDSTSSVAAETKDLNLVSPGTPLIQTKTASGDISKIVESTEQTLNSLADTALWNSGNRKQLSESVQRIQSNIKTELTSVQAWKEVVQILKDYGVDLQKETTVVVRPPSDVLRLLEDVTSKQFNVLINGEIVQIQLDYQKGVNTKEQLEAGEPVQPDDEWVLRIRGYKGFDPTAPIVQPERPKYERRRPEWFRKINKYWQAPLQSENLVVKTHGDVIVLGGTVTIALSYAASYAYYLDQIEQAEQEAKEKQAVLAEKKKKAASAAAAKKKAEEKAKEEEQASKKGWLGRQPKPKPAPTEKKVEEKPKKETTNKAVEAKKEIVETKKDEKKEGPKEEKPKVEKPVVVEEPKEVEPVPVVEEKRPKKEDLEPMEAPPKLSEPESETVVDVTKAPAAIPEPGIEDSPLAAIEAIPEDDNTSEDEDDDVKVVIDFDKDGKVVIKVDDESTIGKRNGALDFLQALYFPWLGWFVSSSPTYDDRSKFMKFTQALFCPWAGIFFPKDWSTTKVNFGDDNKK